MQDNKISTLGIFIWLVCAIFFTYEFLLRTVIGTFHHPIMNDLNLSPISFAVLSSTAFIAVYGMMQVPVGIFTDRAGLKKSLAIAVTLCVISTFSFAFVRELKLAVLCRMLMGLGASFGFICLLVAVYDWLPRKYFGLFIGLSQFIGTLGPMLAAGPLDGLSARGDLDWRSVFFGLGFFGIVIFVLVMLFVKNNKEVVGHFKIISQPTSIQQNIYSILRQKQTWLIAIYSALIFFSIEYLSENEGKAYIELAGFSSNFASYMITIGWAGYAIGCPLWGFLSDHFRRRKAVMVLAAFCCLVSMILIVYFPSSQINMIIAFILLGLGAAGQSVGFAIMAEQCNKYYMAAGLGFNNAMIAFVSAANAPFLGWILDFHGTRSIITLEDYRFGFSFIVALVIVAFLLSVFMIKETFCRPTKEFTLIKS